jgi:hypothetical protein
VFCVIAQLGLLCLVIEPVVFLVISGFLEQVAMLHFVLLIVGIGTVVKFLFVLECYAW